MRYAVMRVDNTTPGEKPKYTLISRNLTHGQSKRIVAQMGYGDYLITDDMAREDSEFIDDPEITLKELAILEDAEIICARMERAVDKNVFISGPVSLCRENLAYIINSVNDDDCIHIGIKEENENDE